MRNCKYCGSNNILIIMWDGDRCGGSKIKCNNCGRMLEEKTYHAGDGEQYPLFPANSEENENGN